MKLSIGIDLGSTYTKAVVLDTLKNVKLSLYIKKGHDDPRILDDFLLRAESFFPGEEFTGGVTGSGAPGAPDAIPFIRVNEIMATAAGMGAIAGNIGSIVEIGGQTSKFIVLNPGGAGGVKEFELNDSCAAGCGAFLEQQAGRLHMEISEFARHSASATRSVPIAGRCAVFAKSDMIHLQQKGIPSSDIALGLCAAMCRNFTANLIKGRAIPGPVFLAGGAARNEGIIRAFRESPEFSGKCTICPSPFPGLEGAVGAAVLAATSDESHGMTLPTLRELLGRIVNSTGRDASPLKPLARSAGRKPRNEPAETFRHPVAGYLGADVGSVSTDLAVIDSNGRLISAVYLATRGQPVSVLREGLLELKARFEGGLTVHGCGVTGSGRHLAGRILGADAVKNEISCQTLSARHFLREVDTIFEIGGQDSKFISVREGRIDDFVMNRICAAGTGSFLEEQASELGIDIERDFSNMAFESASPVCLGSGCTVFMETEVVNAATGGVPMRDICSGLAFSVVRNYLEKVVGNRSLGDNIVFQGGVASNEAVVSAFEAELGKPVKVHEFNRISGAIGAALASMGSIGPATPSAFLGLDPGPEPRTRTFQCSHCSNNCEVTVMDFSGRVVHFGDVCEKYSAVTGGEAQSGRIPNLSEEYLQGCARFFSDHRSRARAMGPLVGIPRASTFMGRLPFWGSFFMETGCRPVLSARTRSETLAAGSSMVPAGVCLPIKIAAGHVTELVSMDLDFIFLPSVMRLPGDDLAQSYACPYAMVVPFIIDGCHSTILQSPIIDLTDPDSFAEGFEPCRAALGLTRSAVHSAFTKAERIQAGFDDTFRMRAERLMEEGTHRHVFALLGKPYNIFDPHLNLSLSEHLGKMGVLALPQQILPVKIMGYPSNLPWRFSADTHRTAQALAGNDRIHPILISNFGCGTDAFAMRQVETALRDTPHLFLEFDEHRGEAGMLTRLEAFADRIEGRRSGRTDSGDDAGVGSTAKPLPANRKLQVDSMEAVFQIETKNESNPGRPVVYIPQFADHAFAYSGLWTLMGFEAVVLPLPGPEVKAEGERHSLGKECHPYSLIAGDLVNLHATCPKGGVFFFPGTSFPCLLQQYGPALRLLMNEMGISEFKLCSPTGRELLEFFGLERIELFYTGLLCIELLVKAACETKPYEVERGLTDRIHRENMRLMQKGVAEGNPLQAFAVAVKLMASIRVDKTRPRPLIGIVGDIYTKVNQVANQDLYRWLEGQGMEVWPSPFQANLLDFDMMRKFFNSAAHLDLSLLLSSGTLAIKAAINSWKVRFVAGQLVLRGDEPGFLELKRLGSPYMPNQDHPLLFLNIAKIVDFIKRGADGIINVVCFNCMVGNCTASIIEKIRRDYREIPIITATYSSGDNPSRRMVLEAFVSQVIEGRKRRMKKDGV